MRSISWQTYSEQACSHKQSKSSSCILFYYFFFSYRYIHRCHPKFFDRSLRPKFKMCIVEQYVFIKIIFTTWGFIHANFVALVSVCDILYFLSQIYYCLLFARLSSYLVIKGYSEIYCTLLYIGISNIILVKILYYLDWRELVMVYSPIYYVSPTEAELYSVPEI
jgi:hypothetical protein